MDELDSYYLNDEALEGECSDVEGFVFMSTEALETEFDEAALSEIFAQLAAVQKHKNNLKKARGFFESQCGKKGKWRRRQGQGQEQTPGLQRSGKGKLHEQAPTTA